MRAKKSRKLLSTLLAVAMTVSMLAVPTFAAEDVDTGVEGLHLDKTAVLTDDGTYTINLEAFSTGKSLTVMSQKPTDVVLVLDVSGSMKDNFNIVTGKAWTSVKDKVHDHPSDAHHRCPDGTYSPVTWRTEGTFGTTHRYTCNNCFATRKWSAPLFWDTIPGEGDSDSWNLWRYTDIIESLNKMEELKKATEAFLAGVVAKNAGIADTDQQHRVAIVKFADDSYKDTTGNDFNGSYNYTQTVVDMTAVNADTVGSMNAAVDALTPAGATAVDYGIKKAQSILENSGDRDKVVVVFTDGMPTHSNGFQANVASAAIETARLMKTAGTSIYTVGMFTGADLAVTTFDGSTNSDNDSTMSDEGNVFMNAVSSNYKNATASYTSSSASTWRVDLKDGGNNGYYKTAGQTAGLTDIFKEISSSVGTTTVTLDDTSVLKDVLNDGFVMTGNSTVTVKTATYTGRDNNGNRIFDVPVASNLTAAVSGNTISVTGFDYSSKYLLDGDRVDSDDFRPAKQGEKLIVTITGVEATDPAVTDALIGTNSTVSGIYENSGAVSPAAMFPVPQTQLSNRTYVVDYAKEVSISDLPSNVVHMDADGMNKFSTAATSLDMTYGAADADSYTPQTMQWGGYDSYYVFGKWNTTPTGVTTGDNTWTKVSVMPANNVYYEDTFKTDSNGTVGIVYTGDWTPDGTASGNKGIANNIVHGGWIDGDAGLSDDTTYSDGSAHVVTLPDKKATATATFTFTGTGVDIYSRTNSTTGTILVSVVPDADTMKAGGKAQYLIVDNLAASGDYYQIPTVSYMSEVYGTYTVTINVTSAADTRLTYYLDGVKVYNPLNPENVDEIVYSAYGDEITATFQEVRDILLDAKSLGDDPTTKEVDGAVFIDQTGNNDGSVTSSTGVRTNKIGTYEDLGPKNEVYLASGQAIVFKVADHYRVQVGLKALAGTTTAQVSNGENAASAEIAHSSDLFYEITPITSADGNYVVVKNVGTNLLSITKVKFIGSDAVGEVSLMMLSADEAIAVADEFDTMPVVAYSMGTSEEPDIEVEEPEVPTTPAPEEPEDEQKPEKPGKGEKPDKDQKPGKGEKPGHNNKPGKPGKPGHNNKPNRNEKYEMAMELEKIYPGLGIWYYNNK